MSSFIVPKAMPRINIAPQPGFQTDYLSCGSDILIAGGAAGCGKSWASIVDPLRFVSRKNFNAVIFRRTYPELIGAGSIWDMSCQIYPHCKGEARFGQKDWTFPSGSRIQFKHLQHEHDIYKHQGPEYDGVYFEELTHFLERQFWYLNSRLRSTSGVKPYLRATCNPDSDSFVAELIDWWIDDSSGYPILERAGKERWFVRPEEDIEWGDSKEDLEKKYPGLIARSLTFIPGKLEDNQVLLSKDPEYRGRLQSLNLVERERLLRGNWKIRPAAGLYFRREYFEIVEAIDGSLFDDRIVRFWDKAATEDTGSNNPSWTVGVKMAMLTNGKLAILDVVRFRGTPHKVDQVMRATAVRDGHQVTQGFFQDPGQAGVVDKDHTKGVLCGFPAKAFKVQKGKVEMAGPFSAQAEGGNVVILNGPWVDDYFAELEWFPTKGKKDDQVDATSGAYQMLSKSQLAYL